MSLVLISLLRYVFSRIAFYVLSFKLPGPTALPLIGNALEFLCKNEELLERFAAIMAKYPSPMRFWLGPKLLVVFYTPAGAETILSSSKMNWKDDVYRFMKPFLGNGLIPASGRFHHH